MMQRRRTENNLEHKEQPVFERKIYKICLCGREMTGLLERLRKEIRRVSRVAI